MPDPKVIPPMQQVAMLDEGELISQIIPFGASSLACLTTSSRVLIPGKGFGEWFMLPVPPPFSSTEQ